MNLKEYLADGPKKMFSMFEGIVTVELVDTHALSYILGAETYYNADGTFESSKYRVLFTLEEAEQFGFVVKRAHWGRVKYRGVDGRVHLSGKAFTSKAQFEERFEGPIFISFVDDEFNECPPPPPGEWVETKPEFMTENSWPDGQNG
jgi:hypothetical protein